MRFVPLVASAIFLISSGASAHVFDPTASFLNIRIGGLDAARAVGQGGAQGNAVLSGGAGAEQVVELAQRMGKPSLWRIEARDAGTQFFTGTPFINNLFFTVQNQAATYTHGTDRGTFQGKTVCASPNPCFGSTGPRGLLGQLLVDVGFGVPLDLGIVGAGGKFTIPVGIASFALEGAEWLTGTVTITNIATNLVQITNNALGPHGGRAGVTGVGFTLAPTVNENTLILSPFGIVAVSMAGSTSFGTNPQQVTLVSPIHFNASTVTGTSPLPGVAVKVLRYVPEPGTSLLLGSAVAGLLVVGRRRVMR